MNRYIIKILIIVSLLRLSYFVYLYSFLYLTPYSHRAMSFFYSNSQYVKGRLATTGIGDDGLYAFAGHYYLNGGDISGVNFENPPLGKYLIGLSILLFKNEFVISLIYGIGILLLSYKLAQLVFNPTVAALSVLFLSFSPLYLDQLTSSLLDLPATLFILASVYYFLQAYKNNKNIYFSSFFLSLAIVTKFFPSAIFFILIFAYSAYKKSAQFFLKYLVSLLILPVVYIFSHAAYFYYHPSIFEFLRYQKWILSWRSGNPFIIGNILRSIILKKYQSWWDDNLYIDYNNWSILSPIIPLFSLSSYIIKNINQNSNAKLIYQISILYFAYVFVGTTGIEKYLLPVYPLMVILTSYFLIYLFNIIIQYGRIGFATYKTKS